MRPKYESTVVKFAGAKLDRVVLYLDAPGVKGCAYTAMSRVRHGSHCLLGCYIDTNYFVQTG